MESLVAVVSYLIAVESSTVEVLNWAEAESLVAVSTNWV